MSDFDVIVTGAGPAGADAAAIARQEGVSGVPLRVEDVRGDTTAPNAFAVCWLSS